MSGYIYLWDTCLLIVVVNIISEPLNSCIHVNCEAVQKSFNQTDDVSVTVISLAERRSYNLEFCES